MQRNRDTDLALVQVEKAPKPVASCAMPAGPGMNIKVGTRVRLVGRRTDVPESEVPANVPLFASTRPIAQW